MRLVSGSVPNVLTATYNMRHILYRRQRWKRHLRPKTNVSPWQKKNVTSRKVLRRSVHIVSLLVRFLLRAHKKRIFNIQNIFFFLFLFFQYFLFFAFCFILRCHILLPLSKKNKYVGCMVVSVVPHPIYLHGMSEWVYVEKKTRKKIVDDNNTCSCSGNWAALARARAHTIFDFFQFLFRQE